jgi:hypothetical protein
MDVTDWAAMELRVAEGDEYLSGKEGGEMGRRQIDLLEQQQQQHNNNNNNNNNNSAPTALFSS